MSLRTANTTNIVIPGTPNRRSLTGQTQNIISYFRSSDWLGIGTSTATQYIQMLVAVWDQNSNFISFTTTGATTIDWGDGTAPENVASNTQANHIYSYANVSNLTSRGYRQAVITITPQVGQNITAFSIQKKHPNIKNTTASVGSPATPILDITLKIPNLVTASNLVLGSSNNIVSTGFLEQVTILNHGLTSFSGLFYSCIALQNVVLNNTGSVTNTSNMFNNCQLLRSVPLFDTRSVTLMPSMFYGCTSLVSVPLFNTINVTNMSGGMFNGCTSLVSVPLFDTRSVTNFNAMFRNCNSLASVPSFNTINATDMGNMFSSCYALQSIPQFDTRKITTFSAMCLSNTSLRQMLGPFTATLVTTFSSMFSSSYNLSRCQITGTNQTISFLDCNLGGTEIDEIFSGLSASGAGKTITMTGNWGTSTATRSIATTKGWTVVL